MQSGLKNSPFLRRAYLPVLVLAIATLVYGQYGLDGLLKLDHSIFVYAGQRMAEGIPPYVSIFDHKAPLAYILPGWGVMLGRQLGADDIYSIRLLFLASACITVVAVYLLGQHLFRSSWAGLFSAFTFLGFTPFARSAAWGPQPKVPMLLFIVLALVFTSQKRWFWAGLFGSLAALVWQPMVIFPVVSLIIAYATPKDERWSAVARTLLGALLPLGLILVYFQLNGSIYELWEGSILFNLWYLERRPLSLADHILKPLRILGSEFSFMLVVILIGLAVLLYIFISKRTLYRKWGEGINQDEFAPLLLSLPLVTAWSLYDFQAAPDFYVFLPYVAIGFGHFLDLAVKRVEGGMARVIPVLLGIGLVVLGAMPGYLQEGKNRLTLQREGAMVVARTFGGEAKIVSIGAPRLLVLLERANPTRFVFIRTGIDSLIQATYPGGFAGWVDWMADYDPDVIDLGPTWGVYTKELIDWLEANYHEEQIGRWRLWLKNE